MAVDWTKPIQTRDGRKARFIGRLECKGEPVLVAVRNSDSVEEYATTRAESGAYMSGQKKENFGDIINVPPQPVTVEIGERWANVYSSDVGGLHLNVFHGKIAAAENAKQAHPHYICSFKLPSTIEGEVLSP